MTVKQIFAKNNVKLINEHIKKIVKNKVKKEDYINVKQYIAFQRFFHIEKKKKKNEEKNIKN